MKLSQWEGFIFVNLSPKAESFGRRLESLSKRLAPYGMKDMKLYDRQQYDLGCN